MQRYFLCLAIVTVAFLVVPAKLCAEDVASYVARAKAHVEQREYDKAIADCDKAIELDFNSAEAYELRGRAWIGKADREEAGKDADKACAHCRKALDDCDEALAINSKLADAHTTRADAWRRLHQFDKALADCDKAIAIEPKAARAYGIRGDVRVFTREYDKVIADCNKALSLDPKLAEAYSYRAVAWLEKREYDKALADCDKTLALDPKAEEVHLTRGNIWAGRGEPEKALAEYKRALEKWPDDWRALNDMGVGHYILGQVQERNALAAEAAGDAKTAKACRKKADALKKEARGYWERGIISRPTASDMHSNLGYAYSEASSKAATSEETGRLLDRAEYYLRRAVACDPEKSRPHNNLGRILLRRSQQDEAEARAAEAKSTSDPAEADRAEVVGKTAKEKRDAAIEQFEKAVELEPSLLEAHLNLGEVFTQSKEFGRAESQYQAIQKYEEEWKNKTKDPDTFANFSQAQFGSARIALARGEGDEAIGHLKKAIELNPNNLAALQSLTTQRYQRGEYRDGEKCFSSWLSKLPPAARRKAAEQLAKQLKESGKHEAAEKVRTAAKGLVEK
jgi:tetratricopeptide (TPR) repeat protein